MVKLPDSAESHKPQFRSCTMLRQGGEITGDIVGIERPSIEESVAAQCQATLRRTYAQRLGQRAFQFGAGARQRGVRADEGRAVEVGAKGAGGGRGFLRGERAIAPSRHLRVEPGRLTAPREVRRLAILEHEVGIMYWLAAWDDADAVGDGAQDRVRRPVEIGGAGEDRGAFRSRLGFDEMLGGGVQRADQAQRRVASLVRGLGLHRQHLLDSTPPDLRGGECDPADAAIHRDRVPWLADTNAVDVARRQRIGREGRAGHDDLDIVVGADADLCQPVAQHVIVAGIAMHHPEAEPAAGRGASQGDRSQCGTHGERVAKPVAKAARLSQGEGEGDGVSVKAEHERHRERDGGPVAPERRRDGERGDQVRGIDQPVEQPVPHRRPGDVAHQVDLDVLGRGEAEFARQDRQGRIDERHEPDAEGVDAHARSPNKASLVTIASATSAIRRFDFIAWLRSSA